MATVKIPPYKQFLTPALHRRFTGAAIVICAICYVQAVLIGEKTSLFWSWFPVGFAGIKTLLLFISALSVFVLRVAQLHLGSRATPSPWMAFTQYLVRLDTLRTFGWYLFSAWFFSEVYVWSAAPSADLGWIAQGKSWERRKLNERPIYLRSVFLIFAVVQSCLHLYYDYDYVFLSTAPPTKPEPTPEEPLGLIAGTKAQLLAQLKPLQPLFWFDGNDIYTSAMRNVVLRAICLSLLSPFIYAIFLRKMMWSWSLAFANLVWDVPPTPLSYIPPHYPSLIYRSLISGFFLVLLWEASNALFTAYVAQAPLKRAQTLTAESRDPNGTLLTGLKSKKEIPKTFALWELLHICAHPCPRRTSIFTDIDRSTGPLWTQILNICLSQISAIHTRISPPATVKPEINIETLPRLTPPIRHENILTNPPKPSTPSEKTEAIVGGIAKSFGQSSHPGTPNLPRAASSQVRQLMEQKLLPSAPSPVRKLLPPAPHPQQQQQQQQQQQPTSGLLPILKAYTLTFLRSPLGQPFRQTVPARARATILGSPTSSYHQIIYSIRILSTLAVASLTEDPYGKVAQDIPALIRTYVSTIRAIEGYIRGGLDVHWTDVERRDAIENGSGPRKERVEGVEEVVVALREGLRGLLDGFGRFAGELGMESGEIDVAREVAGKEEDEEEKGEEAAAADKGIEGRKGVRREVPKGLERREMEELRT